MVDIRTHVDSFDRMFTSLLSIRCYWLTRTYSELKHWFVS